MHPAINGLKNLKFTPKIAGSVIPINALNNGMKKFPGVLLFSSRDHQIVETTANRIMEILPGGKMIDKITTYDEYLASDATAAKRQAILDLNTEEQDD